MTQISNLNFKRNPQANGFQVMKKKLVSIFRAELKKIGINAEYLTEAEVLRLHADPVIKEKIAKLERLNAQKKQKPITGGLMQSIRSIQPIQNQQVGVNNSYKIIDNNIDNIDKILKAYYNI